MKNKHLLVLAPVVLILELLVLNTIATLVREPADIAVIGGMLLLTLFLFANFFLIKYTIKIFKK